MKDRVHWLAMHGFVRAVSRAAARGGDPQARLLADPTVREDPVGFCDELHERGPLIRCRVSYLTPDHAVAGAVLRSEDFRVNSLGTSLPAPLRRLEERTRSRNLHPLQPPSLLAVEPPEHTRYRKTVSSVFTARAVAGLRERVEATAEALLDRLTAESGVVDVVERYCAQLPVAVISDILGVPDHDRARVLEFGELAAPSLDIGLTWPQYRRVSQGLSGFDNWLADHLARLRRCAGDDLMSQLIRAADDDNQLDDLELRATAGLVLAAGFETTVNLLGNGIRMLAEHPDQLATLRGRPEAWPNANRHLAFSGGRHFCLGAALARAEGEVGLRAFFERFPDARIAGAGVRRDTRVLRGWSRLPVQLGTDREPAGSR